jgi:hypothetical protein
MEQPAQSGQLVRKAWQAQMEPTVQTEPMAQLARKESLAPTV